MPRCSDAGGYNASGVRSNSDGDFDPLPTSAGASSSTDSLPAKPRFAKMSRMKAAKATKGQRKKELYTVDPAAPMTEDDLELMGVEANDTDAVFIKLSHRATKQNQVPMCASCLAQTLYPEDFQFEPSGNFRPPSTLAELVGFLAARPGVGTTPLQSAQRGAVLDQAFESGLTSAKDVMTKEVRETLQHLHTMAKNTASQGRPGQDGSRGLHAFLKNCEAMHEILVMLELEVRDVCLSRPDDNSSSPAASHPSHQGHLTMRTAFTIAGHGPKVMGSGGLSGDPRTVIKVATGKGTEAVRMSKIGEPASTEGSEQPNAAGDDDGGGVPTRRAEVAAVAAMTEGLTGELRAVVCGSRNTRLNFTTAVQQTDRDDPRKTWPGLPKTGDSDDGTLHITGNAMDASKRFMFRTTRFVLGTGASVGADGAIDPITDCHQNEVGATVFNSLCAKDPINMLYDSPAAYVQDPGAEDLSTVLAVGKVDSEAVAGMVAAAVGRSGLGQWASNLINTAVALRSAAVPRPHASGERRAMGPNATAPALQHDIHGDRAMGPNATAPALQHDIHGERLEGATQLPMMDDMQDEMPMIDYTTEDDADTEMGADNSPVPSDAEDEAAADAAKAAEENRLARVAEADRVAEAKAVEDKKVADEAAAASAAKAAEENRLARVAEADRVAEAKAVEDKKVADEAASGKTVTNAAASSGRARSVSSSSAGSGSSRARASARLTNAEQKQLAATKGAHFDVISTKVRPTTTGTDSINNHRVNALTTVVPVKSGDVILEMILPCAKCTPTQPAEYERMYASTYGQPSIEFCAGGGKWYAELIGAPPPESPGGCKISALYYANDASDAASAGAEVKIDLCDPGTCRVIMTATKSAKSGSEILWKYANSYKTLEHPTSYQPGTQRRPPFHTKQALQRLSALVRASGAEVVELPLSLTTMKGDGNCFYSMLLHQLHHLGMKDIKSVRELRQRYRQYLESKPQRVVQGFECWLESGIDGQIPEPLQTYRDETKAFDLNAYAARVSVPGSYANAFDISHILPLFNLNLGTFVYTPNAKGDGYDVTPEVTSPSGAGCTMIFCVYYRMGADEMSTLNHYESMTPLGGRQAEKFLGSDHITISFLGVLPQPPSSDIASAADDATTTEPPSSDIAPSADDATTTEPPSSTALTSTSAPAKLPSSEQAPEVASASAALVVPAAAAVTISIPANPTGAVTWTGNGKGKGKGKGKRPAPEPLSDADTAKRTRSAAIGLYDGTTNDGACAAQLAFRFHQQDIAAQRARQVQVDNNELAAKRIRDDESAAATRRGGAEGATREKRPRKAAAIQKHK